MAFSLTWLPFVLKEAGLKVAEMPGWQTRGLGDIGRIRGVICHHTGDTRSGNMPSMDTLLRGRPDLRGPLAQLGLGRDGTFYVIAAGLCQHAGPGEWMGCRTGNTSFIGIEAEHPGSPSVKWPDVQLDAYQRGVAAILKHLGLGVECCAGHKEWARERTENKKTDPTFDMVPFRGVVASLLNGDAPPPVLIPAVEPTGSGRPTLRRGDTGEHVTALQKKLGIAPPGPFGPKTEAAVREFQRQKGEVPDGIVGPDTWKLVDALP